MSDAESVSSELEGPSRGKISPAKKTFKKLIQILKGSWNHEYFGSLARFTLTLQETRSLRDSMNLPKIEFIAYIYILRGSVKND